MHISMNKNDLPMRWWVWIDDDPDRDHPHHRYISVLSMKQKPNKKLLAKLGGEILGVARARRAPKWMVV